MQRLEVVRGPIAMKTSSPSASPYPAAPAISRSFGPHGRLAALATIGLVCALALARPAGAREPGLDGISDGAIYAALADYARQIGGPQPLPASAAPRDAAIDDPHAANPTLLAFARDAGGEEPSGALAPPGHGAMADDTFDDDYSALRDFVRQIGGDVPEPAAAEKFRLAQAEKPKAAKPAKAKAVKTPSSDAGDDAYVVGSKVCLTCHAKEAAQFAQTVMGKIGKVRAGTMECENCHGPGSAHVKAGGGRGVGGIISFRNDDTRFTPEENNGICLGCHEKGERNYWRGSTHDNRSLSCTSCHVIMTNVTPKFQLAKLTEMDTCFQCHKEKRAQMWRSGHMPVREGKMTCSSCHNPHGTDSESLLREATINDTCYKCHAEKRGPFLFEHQPVRENCANCHDPHGSINDFLLKMSRPRLCQQCHANLTGHPGNPRNPQSIYAINRECQNCHAQVHGSNNPAAPRFLR